MKKRKLNITIEIEDNDVIQYNLENTLKSLLGDHLTDSRVLPNTEHLKDNEAFKKLLKHQKDAKNAVYKFINENRK